MEVKHTPGPWAVNRNGSGGVSITTNDRTRYIAIVSDHPHKASSEQIMPNAAIMAAAPEMYDTLIEIREWYEKNHEHYFGTDTPVCFSKALSRILAINERVIE